MVNDTIIGFTPRQPRPLQSLIADTAPAQLEPDDDSQLQRLFKIRAADSRGRRSSATILVNRMYAWRGYRCDAETPSDVGLESITLVANDGPSTVGTVSLGFDKPSGLLVDELFGDEVDALRDAGRRVCEFTKLAVDGMVRSKKVLASLFHVAYIYAHRINDFHEVLIEVNPRHVPFYEKMLGFEVIGPQRTNRRVNAPAVLLRLDFSHAQAQIKLFAGEPQRSTSERSLYPYFFSIDEEAGIVGRLRSGST